MTTKQTRVAAAMSDPIPDPPEAPPPTDAPKRTRRSPADVQRDRLTERIRKLAMERDAAVLQATHEIRENAEAELKEKLARTAARVTARFADRIAPLQTMLEALRSPGG